MGSGLTFDGKRKDIKEGEFDEHVLFAREALPNTSLGNPYRNDHQNLRADRYDVKANDASYIISSTRPSEPSTNIHEPNLIRPSVSYVVSRSGHLESNVDHWMGNDSTDREESRTQRESAVGAQHSFLAPASSGAMSTLRSIMTLLQVMAVSTSRQRWCSPRTSLITMLNCVDLFATYVKQVVSRVRAQLTHLAIDQVFHQMFVMGMDIVMALHALIFLILSVYQASTLAEPF